MHIADYEFYQAASVMPRMNRRCVHECTAYELPVLVATLHHRPFVPFAQLK
jgi:hypothetical protein